MDLRNITEIEINGIYITKNDEIYLYGKSNIYKLDLNDDSVNKINRFINYNQNSLIIIENKKKYFITNCYNQIKFFEISKYKTIITDLKLLLLLFIYWLHYPISFHPYFTNLNGIIFFLFYSLFLIYIIKLYGIYSKFEYAMNKKYYLFLKIFTLIDFFIFDIKLKNKNK